MMKKKVVVAMSGGVDSSVAAALLLEQGYEVIGVTLRLFQERKGAVKCCGGADSAAKARASAQALGIRHYFKSAHGLFSRDVIDNFTASYLAGATPNPCVECNRSLKFSYLYDLALGLGADALATGHYAVVKRAGAGWGLYRGSDPVKDQTYFLSWLDQAQLGRVLFPIGQLPKAEVRRLAAEVGVDPLVRFVQPEDVPRWLQGADAGLALPRISDSKDASFPTKIAEYLACGLAVLATPIGDVADFEDGDVKIKEGEGGSDRNGILHNDEFGEGFARFGGDLPQDFSVIQRNEEDPFGEVQVFGVGDGRVVEEGPVGHDLVGVDPGR